MIVGQLHGHVGGAKVRTDADVAATAGYDRNVAAATGGERGVEVDTAPGAGSDVDPAGAVGGNGVIDGHVTVDIHVKAIRRPGAAGGQGATDIQLGVTGVRRERRRDVPGLVDVDAVGSPGRSDQGTCAGLNGVAEANGAVRRIICSERGRSIDGTDVDTSGVSGIRDRAIG